MRNRRCRTRPRSRGKVILTPYTRMVKLFWYRHMDRTWRERQFHTVSLREALRKVADGHAEAVVREDEGVMQVVGYQMLEPLRAGRPSPATLTLATMQAVAGLVENRSAVTKYEVWALIGDIRAACVRPKVDDKYMKRALELLPELRRVDLVVSGMLAAG